MSTEVYIKGCDIPLIHFYAEPVDQSVDYAKKLIQKRIGHYREDPLAKKLNDEAILKIFNESTNYNMPRIVNHYQSSIKLPITQLNGSPYSYTGIQFSENAIRLSGYAGGPYAAFSVNIDIYEDLDDRMKIYDTKHHLDYSDHFNKHLILDFVDYFRHNINVREYNNQPTNSGLVMLSSEDTDKLRQWASSHKFTESVNNSKIFESILQEGWTEDQAAKTFEDYSKIRGYDAKEDLMQFAYYGSDSNFKRFAVNVAKLLPKECDLKIGQGGMAISITYKGQGVGQAYRSVNDREVHCFDIEKPVIRFGMKNGSLNTEGAAKRFIDCLQPNIAKAEIKAQEREAYEMKRNANADRIKQVQPDAKDLQRAKDAWGKVKDLNELRKYYDLWYQQNNKITDKAKADRRINAFYNFFLSQEPNIPSSYKSEFNRIKAKFENSMEHLNLHEAVNSKIIFDKILNEGWTHRSGFVPHDGNRMVGGAWASSNNSGEYEKEIEVELDGTYYLVYLTMNADLDQGYDDSVNYSWSDVNIDENSIQLKDMMRELSDEQDVTDPELRNKLFELAKEKLLEDPSKYFENDFYEEPEPPDPPDYDD